MSIFRTNSPRWPEITGRNAVRLLRRSSNVDRARLGIFERETANRKQADRAQSDVQDPTSSRRTGLRLLEQSVSARPLALL